MRVYCTEEFPKELIAKISDDFTFKMGAIFKDTPGYLTNLVIDLDRLIDQPEDERQDLFKSMLDSIKDHMPNDERKTIII